MARMGLTPMTADEALGVIDQAEKDMRTINRLERVGIDIYEWFKYIERTEQK
jgi:hypothetical protein